MDYHPDTKAVGPPPNRIAGLFGKMIEAHLHREVHVYLGSDPYSPARVYIPSINHNCAIRGGILYELYRSGGTRDLEQLAKECAEKIQHEAWKTTDKNLHQVRTEAYAAQAQAAPLPTARTSWPPTPAPRNGMQIPDPTPVKKQEDVLHAYAKELQKEIDAWLGK